MGDARRQQQLCGTTISGISWTLAGSQSTNCPFWSRMSTERAAQALIVVQTSAGTCEHISTQAHGKSQHLRNLRSTGHRYLPYAPTLACTTLLLTKAESGWCLHIQDDA